MTKMNNFTEFKNCLSIFSIVTDMGKEYHV